jgi:hypothetical protein
MTVTAIGGGVLGGAGYLILTALHAYTLIAAIVWGGAVLGAWTYLTGRIMRRPES